SVRAVTKSTGATDDSSAYRPFGEQLGFAGATPQTKGYIGERFDDKTQLLYLHARYYDPALGRFLQADPSDPTGAGVGVNRYAYALNNPVMLLDPFGLSSGEARDNHVGGGIQGRGETDNGPRGPGDSAGGGNGAVAHHKGVAAAAGTFTQDQLASILANLSYLAQHDIFIDYTSNTAFFGSDSSMTIASSATAKQVVDVAVALAEVNSFTPLTD